MLRLLLLISTSVLLAACATVEIPNFKTYVTLPASQDGHWVETITHKRGIIPKAEWEEKKKRGIVLLSEDWAVLKYTLLKNCLANECKSVAGALDGLFYAVDEALKQIPKPKF